MFQNQCMNFTQIVKNHENNSTTTTTTTTTTMKFKILTPQIHEVHNTHNST